MMEKRNWIMMLGALAIVILMFSGSALAYLEVNYSYHWENESDRSQGNGYSINIEIWNQWDYPIEIYSVGINMDWQQPGEYEYDMNTAWLDPGTSYGATFFIYIPDDAYIGDHNYNILIEYRAYRETTTEESWPSEGWDFYVGSGSSQDASDKRDEANNVLNDLNYIDFESSEAADRAQEANNAYNEAENYYYMNDWNNAISTYDQAINFGYEAMSLENDYDPSSGPSDGNGDDGGGIFGDGGMSIDWESIDAGIPAGAMVLLFVSLFIGIIVVMPVVYFLSKD